jgi:hypothetical protein
MAKPQPPLRNLYPRITSFSTLLTAFRKASKGKRYRPDVLNFAANLEAELFQLQHELRSFSYTPGVYRQFPVREPKPRLVSAAPFRDRVVHHALIAVIAPCAASPGPALNTAGSSRPTFASTSPPSITSR